MLLDRTRLCRAQIRDRMVARKPLNFPTVAAQTIANLTSNGTNVDATSFATASVTPTANRWTFLVVATKVASGTPNQPTATGNGLTWNVYHSATQTTHRLTIFTAKGASPSAGAVTIAFAGQTQTTALWTVFDCTNLDTTSPILQVTTQSTGATGTSITSTLPLPTLFATHYHVCCFLMNFDGVITGDAAFSVLGETHKPNGSLDLAVQVARNLKACTFGTANIDRVCTSIELRSAVS